jgi:hypothetical protein
MGVNDAAIREDPVPKYIIHIGPPKAGSKYLQSSLYGMREVLRAEGIHYQTVWLPGTPATVNHGWLPSAIGTIPNQGLGEVFAKLNASDYKYVVLSCEGLFGLTEHQIRYLKQLVGGCSVDVVYYCRRWSDRIPSQWQQNVKMGQHETFPEYYVRVLRSPVSFLDFNPKLVWDKFSRVFGRESIRLIPFDTFSKRKVDIFRHFLKAILGSSIQAAPEPDTVIRNESPGIVDTEIIRDLNYLAFLEHLESRERIRIRFLEMKQELEIERITQLMNSDIGCFIVDDKSPQFDEIYKGLKSYSDRIVDGDGESEMFIRQVRRFSCVQQNYLLLEEVPGLLKRLFMEIRPRIGSR